jgi:hypothetical protein
MIQIHQFSTGIKADRDTQGNWFSRGFTGQYMNSTLPVIPEVVQRSIRNKEFAVAEGAYSHEPAIVARVLQEDEPTWSVVATVTQGRDEYERPFSAYRYFLCEGENLSQLVAWLESLPQLPIFSPFEAIKVYSFTPQAQPYIELKSWQTLLTGQGVPAILQPGSLSSAKPQYLQIMNQLAVEKSMGQPIAWAYNVEALEQPRRFALVQVASEKAEEMLRRSLVNAPTTVAPVADDQAIKSAVKSLTNSSQMKPEVIQTIAAAMANPKVTAEYWKEIFDGQGATKAIKQKLFSPQVVRLLTLRAIILPTTLPEFLTWLNPQLNVNKQSENCEISLEFQEGFHKKFSQEEISILGQRVDQGIEVLLLGILKRRIQSEQMDSAIWLLDARSSCWGRQDFINNIASDLRIWSGSQVPLRTSQRSKPSSGMRADYQTNPQLRYGEEVWNKMNNYEAFADFFGRFAAYTSRQQQECYEIAAYFYQINQGKVPNAIFLKAFPRRKSPLNSFGIPLKKEVTLFEFIWDIFCKYGVFLLIPLLGILIGLFMGNIQEYLSGKNGAARNNTNPNYSPSPDAKKLSMADILDDPQFKDIQQKALKSFFPTTDKPDSGTCKAIQKTVSELTKKSGKSKDEIEAELINLLQLDQSDLNVLKGDCMQGSDDARIGQVDVQQQRWVAGIFNYQRSSGKLKADGQIGEKTRKEISCGLLLNSSCETSSPDFSTPDPNAFPLIEPFSDSSGNQTPGSGLPETEPSPEIPMVAPSPEIPVTNPSPGATEPPPVPLRQ